MFDVHLPQFSASDAATHRKNRKEENVMCLEIRINRRSYSWEARPYLPEDCLNSFTVVKDFARTPDGWKELADKAVRAPVPGLVGGGLKPAAGDSTLRLQCRNRRPVV
jgi:hypothetical protein